MKTISVDDDLFAEIDKHATGLFTHSDVIRKLLNPKPSHRIGSSSAEQSPTLGKEGSLGRFIQSNEYRMLHKGIDKYLAILSWVYKNRRAEFSKIEDYKRGNRVYFARSQPAVEEGGNGNIHAKLIADSNFWALATLDHRSKRVILTAILRLFGFPADEIRLAVATIPDSARRSLDLDELVQGI